MADNILKAIISVSATGVSHSATQVSTAVTKMETGLKKIPSASNQATQSLSNLSRVAQDAPYGFIGIANNINPLLESFQRLKATTGSTGGALKELGKSMTGAGGIGLAIGVVSSLLVVFGDKLFGASKAAKEAEDANKKLAESIAGDIVKLTSLVAIITNVNAKNGDRVNALKAVNQEYGPLLKSMGIEEATLNNIAAAYDKVIDAILRQAVVKGLQEEVEKAVAKTAMSIIALEKAEQKRQQQAAETARTEVSAKDAAIKKFNQYNEVKRDGIQAGIESKNQINQEIGALNNYDTALERLKKQLKADLSPLFDIMKNFSFADLDIKLDKINLKPDKVEIQKPRDLSFASNFNFLTSGLKIPKVKAKFDITGGSLPDDSFSQTFAATQKRLNAIGDAVTNFITPAFNALFDTIAKGGNVFQAFGQAIIQSLTQLISKLITTVALALILSAITGGASGIGFKGASGTKNIFNMLSGFGGAMAGGGPVAAGKTYLIGEQGPELFKAGVSGSIIPNNQISSMANVKSGGISGGVVVFEIAGRTLRGVLKNQERSDDRLS